MRESLIIPMMMFGKFRRERAKRDENGKTIIKRRDKNGKPVYEKEKYWLIHSEKQGDPGIYPSVNHIYTRMRNGRQKLIKPAEDLKAKWQTEARIWADKENWTMTTEEKVIIELTAYFPPNKIKRDTNNLFKLLMDAFTGIIYDDDEFALPRVRDFHHVEKGEKPYIKLDIYTQNEESQVLQERAKAA